jgi:hypothetical protein
MVLPDSYPSYYNIALCEVYVVSKTSLSMAAYKKVDHAPLTE